MLDLYINDMTIPELAKDILYVVYKIGEEETKLVQITKHKSKLSIYQGSLYHLVYKMMYKGRYVIIAPNAMLPFKSLINQQLLQFKKQRNR